MSECSLLNLVEALLPFQVVKSSWVHQKDPKEIYGMSLPYFFHSLLISLSLWPAFSYGDCSHATVLEGNDTWTSYLCNEPRVLERLLAIPRHVSDAFSQTDVFCKKELWLHYYIPRTDSGYIYSQPHEIRHTPRNPHCFKYAVLWNNEFGGMYLSSLSFLYSPRSLSKRNILLSVSFLYEAPFGRIVPLYKFLKLPGA
jgi:hypothetical protein